MSIRKLQSAFNFYIGAVEYGFSLEKHIRVEDESGGELPPFPQPPLPNPFLDVGEEGEGLFGQIDFAPDLRALELQIEVEVEEGEHENEDESDAEYEDAEEYFDDESSAEDELYENPESQTVEVILELRAGHRRLKLSSVQIGSDPEVLSSERFGMNEDEARLFCFNWITLVMRKLGDVMENSTPEDLFNLAGAPHFMDLVNNYLGDAFIMLSQEQL